MSKKTVVKKVAKKKVTAPKEEKVAQPKVVKKVKTSAELVSFSIKATIPVMTFGNIQPEVVVKAKTIEEAQAYALPIIEALFNKYVEAPRDGSAKPAFLSKADVTVTEKIVDVQKEKLPLAGATKPVVEEEKGIAKKGETKEEFEKSLDETESSAPGFARSPALIKADSAIAAALDLRALDIIEQQIKDSTKLTPEEKPMAFTTLLKRRKELTK